MVKYFEMPLGSSIAMASDEESDDSGLGDFSSSSDGGADESDESSESERDMLDMLGLLEERVVAARVPRWARSSTALPWKRGSRVACVCYRSWQPTSSHDQHPFRPWTFFGLGFLEPFYIWGPGRAKIGPTGLETRRISQCEGRREGGRSLQQADRASHTRRDLGQLDV